MRWAWFSPALESALRDQATPPGGDAECCIIPLDGYISKMHILVGRYNILVIKNLNSYLMSQKQCNWISVHKTLVACRFKSINMLQPSRPKITAFFNKLPGFTETWDWAAAAMCTFLPKLHKVQFLVTTSLFQMSSWQMSYVLKTWITKLSPLFAYLIGLKKCFL